MPFVIGQIETVERKVEFELPRNAGKPVKKADFVVELKVHDEPTVKARRKEIREYMAEVGREMEKARTDRNYEMNIEDHNYDDDYVREDVVNIKGIKDAEGKDLEFTPELLEAVMKDRTARQALLDVWIELNGDKALKRKN